MNGTQINDVEKLPVNPIIEAKSLRKTFGDLVAVDNVSFRVYPGECILPDIL
jgi:ABC-type sugar transport system ATPase subunit